MRENEHCIEQQVKTRIKQFNRQRKGVAISIGIFMVLLLLSPVMRNEALSTRFMMLCSFSFFLLAVAFILSFQQASVLFLATTIIMAVLLALNKIHTQLFLTLLLINAGAFLISQKIAGVFIQSATDEIRTINRLKIEATTDFLTQLLNRNGLEQALETAWAFCKRHKKRVGMVMVDIDYFKSYNDVLGHLEGDNILKQVADSIRVCFKRETDIISRIGGEEFLIFLTDIDDEHIVEMAKTLSTTIINLKIKATTKNSPCEFLSVSIGAATCMPTMYDLVIDLYKKVDQALHHAKSSGRNCISFNGNITRMSPEQNKKFTLGKEKKSIAFELGEVNFNK